MIRRDVDLLGDFSSFRGETAELESSLALLGAFSSSRGLFHKCTILWPSRLPPPEITDAEECLLLPDGNAIVNANVAIAAARDAGHHLLVLLQSIVPSNESVGALLESFGLDDHFGVGVPRLVTEAGCLLPLVAESVSAPTAAISRRALVEISDFYVLPEFLYPCLAIRNSLLEALPALDETFASFPGAIYKYLCKARRLGYRTIVNNRSVVPIPDTQYSTKIALDKTDVRRMHSEYPDIGRAKAEFSRHSLHLYEKLLGRFYPFHSSDTRSILLDLRGVPEYMNGTAEAALALCDGFKELPDQWEFTVLAESASARFHSLPDRYPQWKLITKLDRDVFSVAFRPSQPWHLKTIVELHRSALLNFYAVLDTIAWDILFEAPAGLSACWEFMTEYADGLLFNSHYTHNHLVRRFPLTESIPAFVYHHSTDPGDYASASVMPGETDADYWFVIGNAYDHKALATTIDLLVSSYPFQSIRVLGLKSHVSPRVQVLESGNVDSAEIERLFSNASLIVFPSLYEGFGLPVVKGLSYGRTVVARQSELLSEVAGRYRGPGRLVTFSTAYELVDRLGRLLHGLDTPQLALGSSLAGLDSRPSNWHAIASSVLEFFAARMQSSASFKWTARERAIRYLESYCL